MSRLRPAVLQWVVAVGLLSGSSLGAQQPDSAHAVPATPAPARPGPKYPLEPTPLLSMGSLLPRVSLSGYLMAHVLHRSDSTAAAITRARLTAQAAPLPYMGVRLQVEYASSQTGRVRADSTVAGFSLTDAYVELISPPVTAKRSAFLRAVRPALLAGQYKMPFSLEYLTPISLLRTVNRSQVVDRLSLKRDIGLELQGGWSRYGTLAVAVANGEGPNATSNPDNRALAVSRLTVTPWPGLALAAKIGNQGGDHAWGYDGRLLWRGLTVEGETIFRRRPTSSTVRLVAGGGYALVAWRVLPWLEPVYKYDRYWDTRTTTVLTGATRVSTSSTAQVLGVNVATLPEWLRLQLDWTHRDQQPAPGRTGELEAQLVATF